MRFVCLSILICVLCPGALAQATCAPQLSPEAREALAEAALDDFTVDILERGSQTVVVLGEAHRKSKSSQAIARRVIEHFGHVAVEGHDKSMYWGYRLRATFRRLREKLVRRRTRRKLPKADRERTEISSIDDLIFNEAISGGIEAMPLLQLVLLRELWHLQREAFVADARDAEDKEIRLSRTDEILAKYDATIEKRKSGVPAERAAAPVRQIYRLEVGHKPSFAQHLRSLGLASGWAALAPGATLLSMLAIPEIRSDVGLWTAYGSFMYLNAQYAFDRIVGTNVWYQRLFPIAASGLVARDRTMARNIVDLMDNRVSDVLLVIVGQDHVPGLLRRLRPSGFVRQP